MYDQGMQNGSRRRGKSVLGSRVEKNTYSVDPNSSTSSQGLFPQKMAHPVFEGKALGTRLPTPGFQM